MITLDSDSGVFAIVAFPSLDASDRQWIESVRAKHDPQAARIGHHFTLVFPTVLSRRLLEAQTARVAATTEPVRVVLRRAGVVSDSTGGGHVFLMPEEGRDQVTQLHDRLYEGALLAPLRTDVPFRPHITLATQPTIEPLEALAAEINAKPRSIRGFLAEVVLVEVTPTSINPITHFQLGAL